MVFLLLLPEAMWLNYGSGDYKHNIMEGSISMVAWLNRELKFIHKVTEKDQKLSGKVIFAQFCWQ